MLNVLDGLWKDHLLNMDHLKEGIGLRGYGQQDPLVAYKKESFDMFEAMMNRFQEDTVRYLFLMQIVGPDGQPITQVPQRPVETPELPFSAAPELEATQAANQSIGRTLGDVVGASGGTTFLANGNGAHPPAGGRKEARAAAAADRPSPSAPPPPSMPLSVTL